MVLTVPEWVVPRFLEIGGRVGAQRQLSKAEKQEAERDACASTSELKNAAAVGSSLQPSTGPDERPIEQPAPFESSDAQNLGAIEVKGPPLESLACVSSVQIAPKRTGETIAAGLTSGTMKEAGDIAEPSFVSSNYSYPVSTAHNISGASESPTAEFQWNDQNKMLSSNSHIGAIRA